MCIGLTWLVLILYFVHRHLYKAFYLYLQALLFFHYLWIAPFQIAVFCYLIYNEFGWTAFIGVLLMVFVIFSQFFAAKLFAHYRYRKIT